MNSYIQFINHASILVGNEDNAILTDPWYGGSVFDDGWSLLYENKKEEIIEILNKTSHIWISHEHPDHFSIKFFNEYYEFIKNKVFLFQTTKDKRVKKFLEFKKLNIIEIEDGKKFEINEKFEIQVQKNDFYDSALIINLDNKKIINLNDCPLKDEKEIIDFKKKYGTCDILLSQFSYAAWKGGKKNILWRKTAAKEKLKTLKLQSKILSPKILIPFASFIYFSNFYNSYLNDSINFPSKVTDEFKSEKYRLMFLEPYQKLNLNNYIKEKNNFDFWEEKFNDIQNIKIDPINDKNTFEDLRNNFLEYYRRMTKKNSKILMKFLRYLPIFNIFRPVVINFIDLKTNIYIDLINQTFIKTSKNAELSMHSKSIKLIFLQDYGFDTLTINGCFEEIEKNSFIKFTKSFSLGNLNNMGLSLNLNLLFNFKIIFLFLKKIFFVKNKLTYNYVKDFE
ncbi:MBL fold metallo-hydrolase [Candidatus Pelagibacter sp.]|nr:MBL fold metallo-hydrolase [Candidatus Pelagibacter sp.]